MSLLGIDVGTTMCKAAAFSVDGACLASASREYDVRHPLPLRAELPAAEIWDKVQQIITQVVSACGRDPVTALCVGSMGEAVVPVTRSRQILATSILCFDERGDEDARGLAKAFGEQEFYGINANRISPQFTLPKLLWLRRHDPKLYHQADYFLPFGEFVAFMLGADSCFSYSQACRTLLFDVYHDRWSQRVLSYAEVDEAILGRAVPGGTVIGEVSDSLGAKLGLSKGVKIAAGGHDQCCTALGCGCIEPGMAACGMGTFQCITPVFAMPDDPLRMLKASLNIEHHTLPGLYVTFLYNQSGSLVKWFRDTFAPEHRQEADIYARLTAEMPAEPTRILVLPHFEPVLWPEHTADTAGAIVGLHTTTARGEILKAIMECASLYFLPGVAMLAQMGMPVRSLTAVGGGARSDTWLQINADIFNVPVMRPTLLEAGLAGAAILAGLATGCYQTPREATARFVRPQRLFEPDPAHHAFYQHKSQQLTTLYPAIRDLVR